MNCKQGDLAVVIRSCLGNEGAIVQCLEFVGDVNYPQDGVLPSWRVDRWLPGQIPRGVWRDLTGLVPDACLRPIRDQPGTDETLSWKTVPLPAIDLSPKPQREFAK